MPAFLRLPLEIIIEITIYLPQSDYGCLRLSCKHLEVATFNSFARTFFATRHFMRTEFSLQTLIDISKSRLGSHVKNVVIETELLKGVDGQPLGRYGDHLLEASNVTNANEAAISLNLFNEQCANQDVLVKTGIDKDMLAEAFTHLDLDVLAIRTSPDRPSSYGAATLVESISRSQRYSSDIFRSTGGISAFHSVLFALGKASARPRTLEALSLSGGLLDDAFIIPTWTEKYMVPFVSNLERISLNIEAGCPQTGDQRRISAGPRTTGIRTYHLRKFLALLVGLEHLTLHFNHFGKDKDAFFDWLGATPSSSAFQGPAELEPPRPADFPRLKQLELDSLYIHHRQLLAIIGKFALTLEELTLASVKLTDGPLPSVNLTDDLLPSPRLGGLTFGHEPLPPIVPFSTVKHTANIWTNFNTWKIFLTTLAESPGQIQTVAIKNPRQLFKGKDHPIIFTAEGQRSAQVTSPGMEAALKQLGEELALGKTVM